MKHSQTITYTLAIILCTTAAALAPLGVGDFDLSWHTIDGGGGSSSGGGFELAGTMGQHDAGQAMTGGNFALIGHGAPTSTCRRNSDSSLKLMA